jgi:hypothetical protein
MDTITSMIVQFDSNEKENEHRVHDDVGMISLPPLSSLAEISGIVLPH